MYKHGGDLDLKDAHDVSPRDIISNPGPVPAADAKKYFDIDQRPVKRISGASYLRIVSNICVMSTIYRRPQIPRR